MLLGQPANALEEETLHARLYTLQAGLMERLDLEVSFFVSTPLDSYRQVHARFLEACSLFSWQVQHGHCVLLFAARTPSDALQPTG